MSMIATTKQMKELDRIAIEERGIPSLELMEDAAQAVAQAVADYQTWQRAIGRDINPSKLVAMVMEAGAKRVTVTAPTYTAVAATKVSALQGEATVTYGGLEDD